MRATLGAGVTGTSRVLVELRGTALPALRIREPCLKEIGQTGFVIVERVFEIENRKAGRLHAVGEKMSTSYSYLS